jgi:hypothetical protein
MQPEVVLIVSEDHDRSRQVAIRSNRFTIGRGADNDLSVDDAGLSRRHALIEIFDGAAHISDCGSQNGTYVNDRAIAESARLSDGDLISIGAACQISVQVKSARPVLEAGQGAMGADPEAARRPVASDRRAAKQAADDAAAAATGLGSMKMAVAAVAVILLILVPLIILVNRGKTRLNDATSESGLPPSGGASGAAASPPRDPAGERADRTSEGVTSEQVERAAAQVMRRISSDSKPYVFPSAALNDIKDSVLQYRQSARLVPLLRAMSTRSAEIAQLARREGLEPGMLIYLAMTESLRGQSERDPVAAARQILPVLLDIWKVLGGTLADGSLLIIAAYKLGPLTVVRGTSRKSHPLLPRISGTVVERDIWSLHKRGKIDQETYQFVVSVVAIGVIAQGPGQFGVAAEPLIF